jgi:hypothetical protein
MLFESLKMCSMLPSVAAPVHLPEAPGDCYLAIPPNCVRASLVIMSSAFPHADQFVLRRNASVFLTFLRRSPKVCFSLGQQPACPPSSCPLAFFGPRSQGCFFLLAFTFLLQLLALRQLPHPNAHRDFPRLGFALMTRGGHSLLYFAYTCVRDLFIGGGVYLPCKKDYKLMVFYM